MKNYKWNVSSWEQWWELSEKWYTWIDWDFDLSENTWYRSFERWFPKEITGELTVWECEIQMWLENNSWDANQYVVPEDEYDEDEYEDEVFEAQEDLEKDFIKFIQWICKIDRNNIDFDCDIESFCTE